MKRFILLVNKATGQIEHYHMVNSSALIRDLKEKDAGWKDVNHATHEAISLNDPAFTISRDHKVTKTNGKVTGTKASLNPIQPIPPPPRKMKLKSPDGTIIEYEIIG